MLWIGSLPRAAGNTNQKTRKGGSRSVTLDGNPDVECGGVLLSHTLSSAVPSPRPGLSFRVRKGTGRLTWAMTTAKPIQRPTHQGIGRQTEPATRPIPIVAVREPDNGREQKRFTGIVIVTTRNSIPCHPTKETTTGRDPTQQAGRKVCRVRPLVPVGSTPRGASTSGLSNTCSTCGLQTLRGASRNPNLGAGFPLRCFQRLSLPNVANRPCRWRDNRHTRGPSTQVLSYYGQASSGFQRAQRIETKLSHDVLNPARVPL